MRKLPPSLVILVLFFFISAAPLHHAKAQTAITIGETSILTSNDSGNGNLLIAQQATLSQTATIQSLSFYVATASGDLRLGIYDATGPNGGPGAKKAETNSFTPTTGWNTANAITPVSLPAGTYWLAYLPSSSTLGFKLDTTGSAKWYSYTYGAMPATFSTSPSGSGAYHWSFYATLNTSTTPPPATDTTAPSIPTGLGASAVSSSQINLTWTASTDNVGVTGYNVYRNGTPIATVASLSYNDTGLTASTAYLYTVAAYDAAGYTSVQSTAVSATTAAQSASTTSGLDFPGSAAVATTMRFKFDNPQLNGLPIYGPGGNGVTYIWRAYPRQQPSYYTAFFWGNDDGQGNLNTFQWKSNNADTYYGAHPYPRGSNTSLHDWEISIEASDFINGAVAYDRWYTQALRVWSDASGKHHEFYWDLPNTDAAHIVTHDSPTTWGNTNPPAPALTWGDAPWNPGNEVWNGVLRGIQIYNANLSPADIQNEINNPLSTTAGANNIWYLNLNPTPTDIADKSGKGHNPVWVGSERPTLYTGGITPSPPPPPPPTTDTSAPTPPTNLTATAVSSSQINLSWTASTDNVGVTGYDIYRNNTFLATVTTTSYSNTGLAASTAYTYYVRAKDAANNISTQSTSASATTQGTSSGPSIPSSLGWFSLSGTNLRSVCPPDNYGGYWENFSTRCHQIIEAWSGGAVDTLRNSLIVWGGGHNDYYGNEIYSADLNTLAVKRLTNPSPPNTFDAAGCPTALSDGRPNSRHSYSGVIYIEHADRLYTYSGSLACGGGGASQDTWTYDFKTGAWKSMAASGPLPAARQGIVAAYDPNSKLVFVHSKDGLFSYDYDTNSYKQLSSNYVDFLMSAVVDPKRKKLILLGGDSANQGGAWVYDISSGSNYVRQSLNTSGGSAIVGVSAPGLAYDPVTDRIIGWSGGNTVYSLNMDTGVWTPITYTGGPGPAHPHGTFGRFGYVPQLGVFVVANSVDSNIYTLRLSTGTTSPPPPPPPSAKFSLNDRVQTTAALNVRATASAGGTLLGQQAIGNLGTVIGGPTVADGFTWWNINYDTGVDGWSAEDYLVKSITPPPAPAPTISISASPTSVTSGGSTTLSWSSTNATSCTASGSWTGTKPTGGSQTLTNLTTTGTYTLSCTGSGGTTSQSATVSVTTAAPPPPSSGAVGGYPMPSLQDERNAYTSWGWTWNASVEPAAVTEPIPNYYVTLAPDEVRYDTEADDLWNYLMMYRRTGNSVYLDRAQAWLRYFKVEYRDDLVVGDNFAHLYGVGLLAWYEHTCGQGVCDVAALTAAEGIATEVEKYVATYWLPGSNVAYYGPRKAARFLLFATRMGEVTKNPRWTNLRDTLIEIWLKEPSWDARGMYFLGDADTDDILGKGSWAAGARIQSSFQIGVLMESLFQAYRVTGRADLRDRMLAIVNFVDQYGLDSVYQYSGSTFGFVNGKLWHSYSGTTGIATFWESAYTTSLVDTLVMGYKLTGDRRFYDRAKHFFNRATKAKYGSPTERTAADNAVHHFVDTIFSSDQWYLSFNKGELQYTYMIFENGGNPTVLGTTPPPPPPPSVKFSLNDRVQTTAVLNVRATASASGTLLGQQAIGNLGTVIGGPTIADGFTWWNINYDNAPDGWSAETYLVKSITPPPSPPPPPLPPPTTDTSAPTPPTNLTATAVSTSQINLSWTASTDNVGVTGYRVERCQGTGCTTFTQVGTPTTNSYSDAGLTASTAYTYYVRAKDATNNISTQSTSASATTQAVSSGSTIASIAASMAAGEWREVPQGSSFGGGSIFTPAGGMGTLLHYMVEAQRNPFTKKIYLIGCAKNTLSNVQDYRCSSTTDQDAKFVVYDEVTNSWAEMPSASISLFPHTYDHAALDPNTGDYYFREDHNKNIWRYTGGSWIKLPPTPNLGTEPGSNAAEFFPELGGLVVPNPRINGGEIYLYSVASNSWSIIPDDFAGDSLQQTEYNPIHKFLYFSGGLTAERHLYKLDANKKVTRLADAPIPLDIGGCTSVMTTDPLTGKLVAFNCSDSGTYQYDPPSNSWSKTGTHGLTVSGNILRTATVPLLDYGVIFVATYTGTGTAKIYLYKHSSGTITTPPPPLPPPTTDTSAPTPPTNLTATAVSTSQINLSWTASTDNVGVTGYRVERCQGTGCTTFTQVGTPTTNSYSDAGLTASTAYTYRVRATDGINLSAYSTSASATTQNTTPPPPPPSVKFSLNDRVQTTAVLNVRATASASGTLLGQQAIGNLGTVIGGPTIADGFTWWNINYDNAPDGWSAENYLVKYIPPSANVIQVGPARAYKTSSQAAAVAVDGATVEIDAGTYLDDVAVWRQNNLTIRGIGGRAHIKGTKMIPFISGNDQANGKGLWVVKGSNVTVENMEFSGADVPDNNGAGIRQEGPNLAVRNSYFHDNENGILGDGGGVTIEYSEFANNGFGDGQTHNIYISGGGQFTFRGNYSHNAKIGHTLKSRAQENYILYNRITDETGTASYEIDLPNGGRSVILGNLIQQSVNTDNSTIISYGAEGLLNPLKDLYVVNNTIVNSLGSGAFMYTAPGTTAKIQNNLFIGGGTVLSGPGTLVSNITTNTPGLVNQAGYDYHLTATSPAVNTGTNPGVTANGMSLTPASQYAHPLGIQTRPITGTIDVGAYEYGGTTPPSTPAPTVTLGASPTSVASGGSSTLSWSSTNATSCTASGGWSGTKATSDSQTVTPTITGIYTLSCTGIGGTTNKSVTITVTPLPTCTAFTYSNWNTCQSNGTQSRTTTASSPQGCTGGTPVLTQSCTYTPPSPPTQTTCTSFTYSAWGVCQSDSTQSRTTVSTSPQGCTGGTPTLSQSCTYIPPVTAPPQTPSSGGGTTSTPSGSTTSGGGTTISGTPSTGGTTAAPPPASGLTNAQIQAILSLLSSFGADSATITRISAILTGTTLPTTTTTSASFQTNLYFGIKSGDVTKLQQLLAQDPSVYPEGLVTGYYGSLTVKAVQRFQIKYSIVSSGTAVTTGYGVVGPKTRAKLNELGAGQ